MYKSPLSLCCILIFAAIASYNNSVKRTETNSSSLPDSVASGKKIFENNCVRCHGMDATGIIGPSLRRPKLKFAPDVASFTAVVEQGIPGTGMPANWSFSDTECHEVYAYINYLKNIGRETPK